MANEEQRNQGTSAEPALRQQQAGTNTRGPQPDQQPAGQQRTGGAAQTQQARPTWGEQKPDKDQERATGGGGTSSDSDGQQQE